MLCKKPYRQGVAEFGCGNCLPCRINYRDLWTMRLLMESQSYAVDECLFVTLTYDQENVPRNGSLQPRDLALFLKRLRKRIAPKRLRYYGIGEYGEQGERPHYHLILFGVRSLDAVRESWAKGLVHVGTFSEQSAAYVTGYVTNFRKGRTELEKERLGGRYREFASISRRPYGLGAAAMGRVASVLLTKDGSRAVVTNQDAPSHLRVGKRKWPLGRYLRRKLREEAGIPQSAGQVLADARALEDSVRLAVPGARAMREDKRKADQARAGLLDNIARTKGKKL